MAVGRENLFRRTTPDSHDICIRRLSPTPRNGDARRILILHGYGDHSGRYVHLMEWLAARGVPSDAFDFRGHGLSSGRRGFVRAWDDYLQDLVTVIGGDAPPFILAHSHGALVLAAAIIRGVIPMPRGCILTSPWIRGLTPVSPFLRGVAAVCDWTIPSIKIRSGLSDAMMSRDPQMIADSRADSLLLHCATPRWFRTATAAQKDTVRRAGEFAAPLLCLIADDDVVADPIAARQFANAVGSADRTVRIVKGAKHELLRDIDREASFELILQWMRDRAD